MSEPIGDVLVDEQAAAAARSLGQLVMGRELTAEEFRALSTIFKASVQALRHGFIQRMAEEVQTEREAESVEELFENIDPR